MRPPAHAKECRYSAEAEQTVQGMTTDERTEMAVTTDAMIYVPRRRCGG